MMSLLIVRPNNAIDYRLKLTSIKVDKVIPHHTSYLIYSLEL